MFKKIFGGKKPKCDFSELNPEQDEFLGSAIKEYNAKRALSFEKYDFDKYSWFFDQESGVFELKDKDRKIFEADGQIIGSFLKSDGSWEWAWNNPNWKKEFTKDSLLVKDYGQKQKLGYFCEGMIPIGSEEYAQYLTAVGVKISDSESGYHGDCGNIVVYIMLKNFRSV